MDEALIQGKKFTELSSDEIMGHMSSEARPKVIKAKRKD
jgi:hypothetical protein